MLRLLRDHRSADVAVRQRFLQFGDARVGDLWHKSTEVEQLQVCQAFEMHEAVMKVGSKIGSSTPVNA